jgi:predicted ribonuclease YlaK
MRHRHPPRIRVRDDRPPDPRALPGPTPAGVKHFVLDTNVLLHNPNALFVFQDNHVVIPYPVIEELDKMKRRDDDIGRNARAAIRHLDRLRRPRASSPTG